MARARSEMIIDLLDDFGFESDRFQIAWISGAEAARFARIMQEMRDRIRKLGPSPVKTENGQHMRVTHG
jgi:F420-non-reducing hydrogenase iron-sulfur subunit